MIIILILDNEWYFTKRFNLGILNNSGPSKIERTTNSYKRIIYPTDLKELKKLKDIYEKLHNY